MTKSPSSHPGDILKLKCVNLPEFNNMTNVIIFSKFGERPTCNKMSCGDLDGDEYLVTWNKKLVE